MAASYVRELFAGASTGTTTTSTVTPTAGATAGDTVVLTFHAAGTSTTVSGVSDTKGNTWTVDVVSAQASSNARIVAICSTRQDVGALTTSDTITITTDIGITSTKDVWLEEFSGQYVIDVSATSAGATTPITTGITATTASADAFAVAAFRTSKSGATAVWTWTKDANYTNFTTPPPLPTGSQGVSSAAHYRILTATATQAATDTVSATINGYLGAIVVYKPATGGPTTYTKAGHGVSGTFVAGADVDIASETGRAILRALATGADAFLAAETGRGIAGTFGSGIDAFTPGTPSGNTYVETGTGVIG